MHDGFDGVGWVVYTLPDSNIHSGINKHSWLEHGPGLKMYFLLKMGIFQPAKTQKTTESEG